MAGETILVVDDEANIRELARMYLEQEGYQVVTANDGRRALDSVQKENPALMVLDLMLPEVDGWEVCRQVRASSNLPILILTARDDDIDKIVGLELGADDYLTKPFNPRELVARVRAILRRTNLPVDQTADQVKRVGNVVIDPAAREVTIDGGRVNLRVKEFDLLLTLAHHTNMVLSREQLLEKVWGYEYYGETRTVDVHIAHLREKLGNSSAQIETVWGLGYKLVVGDPPGG
jgi:two-component system alkaline phosphatase synthesis response regulator PhoP/two-component system response regulator ResD